MGLEGSRSTATHAWSGPMVWETVFSGLSSGVTGV